MLPTTYRSKGSPRYLSGIKRDKSYVFQIFEKKIREEQQLDFNMEDIILKQRKAKRGTARQGKARQNKGRQGTAKQRTARQNQASKMYFTVHVYSVEGTLVCEF